MNFEAIDELHARFPDLEIIFIESGGDNLAAAFSPELVDVFIYVIDVAQGEKIPRKGGPGIMQSDLLVINKIDLAPYVGASLQVMKDDSKKMRGDLPFILTNLRAGDGAPEIAHFLEHQLHERTRALVKTDPTAQLHAKFAYEGRTRLANLYAKAPLKIAKTFPQEKALSVCVMDASPGLLAGDFYEFDWHLGAQCEVHITTQGFTPRASLARKSVFDSAKNNS